MKKILLFTTFVIIIASSCKKKDIAPENTISATINGVNENFTNITFAEIGNSIASKSSMLITGINPTNNDLIDLQINTISKIVKRKYSNANNFAVTINYGIGNTSSNGWNEEYQTDVLKDNSTTITITSLSGTKIEGTFSATLIGTVGKPGKTVTDGKFNINFK